MAKYYKTNKGRLKIFLGMAAGVGKTYAMLEEAQKKVQNGVDVKVGIVNTHGRPETAKLLEPLSIIPLKSIDYKGKTFQEFDIDSILEIKPDLVVVDELAHTNIPGSKHLKRWQDVVELLEAGIDVYSTLNVQHIESYKDMVEKITGINIRETVPDSVVEMAAEIECIDITPTELIQRLKEGKVYTGDLSQIALKNFFQEDRLTALREMALRCTAEMVDLELKGVFKSIQKGTSWTLKERLLVAINYYPYSQQLIRTGRRLAAALHATWFVVYVDEGGALNEEEAATLSKNIDLARELGAEVITTQDTDVALGIQRVAEQKKITQIIIGKRDPHKLIRLFKRSPVDKLSKISSGIDVHVIRQSVHYPPKRRKRGKRLTAATISYLHALFWMSITTLFNAIIYPVVGHRVVGSIYLITLIVLSLFFGIGQSLFAAAVFALIWNFYFTPPSENFKISSIEDMSYIVLFFITALLIAPVGKFIRKRQEVLKKREEATQAIYEISREINSAVNTEDLLKRVEGRLGEILQGRCKIIPRHNGGLEFEAAQPLFEDEKEKSVAEWVFENGKEAGWSTFTLPSVKNLYLPLKGFKEIVGVLAFSSLTEKPLLPDERNFLYTVTQQLGHYLERAFFERKERESELLQQVEQIYSKVLQSISHEFYYPLQVIQSALNEFKNDEAIKENLKLKTSVHRIEETSDNLLRIAENAAAMAKISGGEWALEKLPHRIDELVETCLKGVENISKEHRIEVKLEPDLPSLSFDFPLMTILLDHLLTNAIEYSPPHTVIRIEAEVFDGHVALSVLDQGCGIPEEMMDLVFEKFYRVRGTSSSGLGLGLAIVKSIAEIHNGWIQVQNREEGGAKFSLILPIQ